MNAANIFVVEDDLFFGNMVKERLHQDKLGNIKWFKTGEECLEHIYESPDIVVLDHNLGSTNGIEILKKIKRINPNIQVIFLSAQEKLNVAIKSLKYGAYDYLEKSLQNINKLTELIRTIQSTKQKMKNASTFRKLKFAFLVTYALGVSTLAYCYLTYPELF